MAALLDDQVDVAKDADTAIFHARDGYAVPVPLIVLRQLKPVLADKVNGVPVRDWSEQAAPLQLAWPNLDQPGIDSDPRQRWWWVGSVTRVELQNWLATYGKALHVPAGAGNEALMGAQAVVVSCIACHRVRGLGGTVGPELKGSTVRRDRRWFLAKMQGHLPKVGAMFSATEVSSGTVHQIEAFLRGADLPAPEEEAPLPAPEPGVPPLPR
ncbi:MAG TPA: hypothetical protein VMK12_27310 [Anaeromyxobacteraceae bacterium]|nr:hypothetical protein [Anaeromyxobacteraceae bacterium]